MAPTLIFVCLEPVGVLVAPPMGERRSPSRRGGGRAIFNVHPRPSTSTPLTAPFRRTVSPTKTLTLGRPSTGDGPSHGVEPVAGGQADLVCDRHLSAKSPLTSPDSL